MRQSTAGLVVVVALIGLSGCANMGRQPVVYAPPMYIQPPAVQYEVPQSEWRPAATPLGEPTLALPKAESEGPSLGHPSQPEEIPAGEPQGMIPREELPAPGWGGGEAPLWRPLAPVPSRPSGNSSSNTVRSMPEDILPAPYSVPPVLQVPELAPEIRGPRKEGPNSGLRPTAPMPWFNPKAPKRPQGDKFV